MYNRIIVMITLQNQQGGFAWVLAMKARGSERASRQPERGEIKLPGCECKCLRINCHESPSACLKTHCIYGFLLFYKRDLEVNGRPGVGDGSGVEVAGKNGEAHNSLS